jgi:hypothetical protein
MNRAGSVLLMAAGLLGVLGCGSGPGEVSGRVTYVDFPVKYGTVTVYTDAGPRSGVLDPMGGFRVTDVPPGRGLKVTVASPDPRKDPEVRDGKRPKPPAEVIKHWGPIPLKYADPDRTPLRIDVRPGGNTVHLRVD